MKISNGEAMAKMVRPKYCAFLMTTFPQAAGYRYYPENIFRSLDVGSGHAQGLALNLRTSV